MFFPIAAASSLFHWLLAAIAPQRLYIAAGDEDTYADPEGQFTSCSASSPAWRIFGASGLDGAEYPDCGKNTGKEVKSPSTVSLLFFQFCSGRPDELSLFDGLLISKVIPNRIRMMETINRMENFSFSTISESVKVMAAER